MLHAYRITCTYTWKARPLKFWTAKESTRFCTYLLRAESKFDTSGKRKSAGTKMGYAVHECLCTASCCCCFSFIKNGSW